MAVTTKKTSKNVAGSGSKKKKAASRAKNVSNLPKVLRIGVIQSGKIIEERIVRRRETVTVGPSEKNSFVLPTQDLPSSRFELFETKGGAYTLNFLPEMNGRVSLKGDVLELADLRKSGNAPKKGKVNQIVLNDQARGKIVIGDSTILFQFVAPPPIQPRPQLPAAVKGSLFANVGAFITFAWLFFFVAESGVIAWWETTDWPVVSSFDKYLQLQELIASEEASFVKPKVEKVEEEGEGDEADTGEAEEEVKKSKKTAQKVAAKPVDSGPKKSAAEVAKERAEKRAALAQQLAERGINKILGTLGGEGGGAIADVLRGGDVGADQDDLLSQVSGVGVATGEASGLKSAGGKHSGEAADISQIKVKKGKSDVVTGGAGPERKIKGKLRKKKPVASGGTGMLNPADLSKIVGRKTGSIKSCYEQALKRNPTLKGKVTVRFTISGSGKVSTARAVVNELTKGVGDCIVRTFKRFRFPPPEGGSVTFEYPFMFTPAG